MSSDKQLSQPPPPPGFQLLYQTNAPNSGRNPFNYMILPIHWSIIRTPAPHHFRLINEPEMFSESLPSDWEGMVKREEGDPDEEKSIELFYKDVQAGGGIVRVRVVEIEVEKEVAIHCCVAKDGFSGGKDKEEVDGRSGLVKVKEYVDTGAVQEGKRRIGEVYKMGQLWDLEGVVQGIVTGSNAMPDPYASKIPKERLEQLEREKEQRRREERERQESNRKIPAGANPINPLMDPRIPFGGHDPIRDLGRADLDPFGGPMGLGGGVGGGFGGMLMDPRGLRRPQLPQGLPPGARFDPVGPGAPPGGIFGPRGGGGGLGAGGPRLPFGFIDPDHERVNSFDDMFS